MQKLRPHIASLFLLLSMTLVLPADYWHDCSHGEEIHLGLEQDVDTELSQDHHCALCDYVSPDITINPFSFSLLGNAPFGHLPAYFQASAKLQRFEHPSLRAPPLG